MVLEYISTLSLTLKILHKKISCICMIESFTTISIHMRIYEITNLKTKPCRLIITNFGFPNSPEIGQNKNYVSIILLLNIHIKLSRRRMKDCKNCIRSYPRNKKARRGPIVCCRSDPCHPPLDDQWLPAAIGEPCTYKISQSLLI